MVLDVLTKVRESFDAERSELASLWSSFVARLAADELVAASQVETVLRSCDRTPDELEAAVKEEKHRRELRAKANHYHTALKAVQIAEAAEADYYRRRQQSWRDFQSEGQRVISNCHAARALLGESSTAIRELERLGEEVILPSA